MEDAHKAADHGAEEEAAGNELDRFEILRKVFHALPERFAEHALAPLTGGGDTATIDIGVDVGTGAN